MTINQRKVLALIPARGGSKGIKNKNLTSIHGKKLIDFTINEAKKSEFIDEVFVSSDSQEILDLKDNIQNVLIEGLQNRFYFSVRAVNRHQWR